MSYTPTRGALKPRKSAAYTSKPSTPSGLSKSNSTPYELFNNSPSRQSSVSSTPLRTQVYPPSLAESQNSPIFRRNAGFGSPGMRANLSHRSSNDGTSSPVPNKKARASKAFIRKKAWTEKLKSVPMDLFFQLQTYGMDIEEILHEPSLGYPIGLTLHVLSLVSHLISPDSSLGLTGKSKTTFGNSFDRTQKMGNKSAQLRQLAKGQAEAWLRWTSVGMSLALLAAACYNAYILFTSRRKYRLWMRSEKEKVASENARLVPAYMEDEEPLTIQERLSSLAMAGARHIPIIGWFMPAEERPPTPIEETRMHELDVWQAPEVPLRIFSVYSPAHALWWQIVSLLGVSGILSWLFNLALMAFFAFQFHFLVQVYNGLVKDRILLAAEVMHEYDEKFVLPRAMPLVRDASTMTSQAETISPSDWR